MNIYNDTNHIREGIAEYGQLYIYAIENFPQGNIKIGRTTNPRQRFSSLSGSNNGGNIIKRVAISPMTYLYSIEEQLHNHYARYRLNNTEYFSNITFDEVVAYIDQIFDNPSYESLNNIRKKFYLEDPSRIPGWLRKENLMKEGN